MDLFVLVAQRKERYEGEYAPEALAVIDEYGNDDNPDYMHDELRKQTESGDFSALAVLRLSVSSEAVNEALFPPVKVIAAPLSAARVEPAVWRALGEAVAAIYFDDNSDYLSALWAIVRDLGGEEAVNLLEKDGRAAYAKYSQGTKCS